MVGGRLTRRRVGGRGGSESEQGGDGRASGGKGFLGRPFCFTSSGAAAMDGETAGWSAEMEMVTRADEWRSRDAYISVVGQ